jgi:type I restriction enzyme S subunit
VGGICSTDAIVIRSRSPQLAGIVLAVASSDAFVDEAVQTSQGTKMPRANWNVLERYPVALPSAALTESFASFMGDTVEVLHRLVMSTRNLRATRDHLLPRLISGDIDVTDLDIPIPQAAA